MSNLVWFSNTTDLSDLEREVWQRLIESPGDKTSGWRLPVMATQEAKGVRQRIVVLRRVESTNRTILVHTDLRSPKVSRLRAHPEVSWLFYGATQQAQLQLTGQATVHDVDNIAESMWAEETESSLRGYLAPLPPGTPSATQEVNLPDRFRDRIPDRGELTDGRANFAVISCRIETAELLLLRRNGNIRAQFVYEDDTVNATWLAP